MFQMIHYVEDLIDYYKPAAWRIYNQTTGYEIGLCYILKEIINCKIKHMLSIFRKRK